MDFPNGQERRAWLERQGQRGLDALSYYLGPGVPVEPLAQLADMFNPVGDMTRAGTAARGVVRPGATAMERVNALGNVATDMASVLAPVAGAAYADDAARGLTEALANWSMPADDAVGRFVGSEYGGIELNKLPMYHGTPDVRDLRGAGGFQPRTKSVAYITDPDRFEAIQSAMRNAEPGSDEYFRLLDEAAALRGWREIENPIFLSPEKRVAASYADAQRALDYQGAEPSVVEAMTNPARVLDVDAAGDTFRGINQESVKQSLIAAGVDENAIDRAMRSLSHTRDGRMSTDDLAIVANDLGFDAVDVFRVIDTYNATGKPSTVRMMLKADQVSTPGLQSNNPQITEALSPAEAAGQNVLDLLKSGRASEVTDDMLDLGDPVLNAQLNDYLWKNYDLPMDEASRMARAREMGADTDAYHATASDFTAFRPGWRGSNYFAQTADKAQRGAGFGALDNMDPTTSGLGSATNSVMPVKMPGDEIARLRPSRTAWDALPQEMTPEQVKGMAEEVKRTTGAPYFDDVYEEIEVRAPVFDERDRIVDPGEYRYIKRDYPATQYQDLNGRDGFGYMLPGYNTGKDTESLDYVARNTGQKGFLVNDEAGTSIVAGPDMPIRSRFARFDPRLAHLRNLSAGVGGLGIASLPYLQQDMQAYLDSLPES